jgi:flagellar biosynthesis/type III secretory pathway chaperone
MFCTAKAFRLVSFGTRTMTNRTDVLSMMLRLMAKMKTVTSRDQHFDLLENAQILASILQEVTIYEKSLIADLDVD